MYPVEYLLTDFSVHLYILEYIFQLKINKKIKHPTEIFTDAEANVISSSIIFISIAIFALSIAIFCFKHYYFCAIFCFKHYHFCFRQTSPLTNTQLVGQFLILVYGV